MLAIKEVATDHSVKAPVVETDEYVPIKIRMGGGPAGTDVDWRWCFYDCDNIVELAFSERDRLRYVTCVSLKHCHKVTLQEDWSEAGRGETVTVRRPAVIEKKLKLGGSHIPVGQEDTKILCSMSGSTFIVTWGNTEGADVQLLGGGVELIADSARQFVGLRVSGLTDTDRNRLQTYLTRYPA